jgi:hypothetical protein
MTTPVAISAGNRRFWVRFHLTGLVDLGDQIYRYELPNDVVIHFRNQRDPKSNTALPLLIADAECTANSAAEAVDMTRDIVEGMAGIVSVATSAMTGMMQPDRAVEVTADVKSRTLLQYMPWPGKARPMRKLDSSGFAVVWEHLMQKPVRDWDAVARAMRWLRKSLLESDNLDRFTALWTGLEALNALAVAKHNLKANPTRLLQCPKCGHSFADAPPLAGVQHIVESTPGIPGDTWTKAKKHRNALLHGGGVDKARREAPKLSPNLHKALVWGILDVLGVPDGERHKLIRAPLKQPETPYIRVEAVLKGLPAETITSGKANPRLVVVAMDSDVAAQEDGSRVETGELDFRLEGCGDLAVRHSVVAMETYWEHDPEKPKPSLQVRLQ